MKILILNPPFKAEFGRFSRCQRSPQITFGGTFYYPIWLSYAVGLLEKNGFKVRFIDAPARRQTLEDVKQELGETSFDLIVLDSSTPSIFNDINVADQLKDYYPEAFVILVGTHPTALPEETLKFSKKIDAVAVGEYEYTILEVARLIREQSLDNSTLEKTSGLCFRSSSGDFFITQKRLLIEDLDTLPFVTKVYKKHLNVRDYFFGSANYPMVHIITGRGCPTGCFYCLWPQTIHNLKYRVRSPENVVEEFAWVKENLPEIKEIGIEDDTFTINKRRVREICSLLIERNLRISWYCNVRVDLDIDTMKLMRKAGCRLVIPGFESQKKEVLKQIHKAINPETFRTFCDNCNKAGLLVHGCFMAGNPGDTKEILEEQLQLTKELYCDSVQFYPLMVYPGTKAYDWAVKNGFLTANSYSDWCKFDGTLNSVISYPHLTDKEIAEYCKRAYKEYFLRPSYILYKIMLLLKHPGEALRNFLSVKTVLTNFLLKKMNRGKSTGCGRILGRTGV